MPGPANRSEGLGQDLGLDRPKPRLIWATYHFGPGQRPLNEKLKCVSMFSKDFGIMVIQSNVNNMAMSTIATGQHVMFLKFHMFQISHVNTKAIGHAPP